MLPGPIRRNPLVAVVVVLSIVLAAGLLTRPVGPTPADYPVPDAARPEPPATALLPSAPAAVEEAGRLPSIPVFREGPPRFGPGAEEWLQAREARSRGGSGDPPRRDLSILRVGDAWFSTAGRRTAFEAVADRLGVPSRSFEAKVGGEATPLVLSPVEWGVTADGRIVRSSSVAMRFLTLVAGLFAAVLAGSLAGALRSSSSRGYDGPFSYRGTKACVAALAFSAFWYAVAAPPDEWTIAFAAVPVLFGGGWLSDRLLAVGWTAFLSGFAFLAQVELEAPFAPLAALYGPVGVHVWDFVGIGGFMAAFLAWRVTRIRFGGSVTMNAPGFPLVQDVRVVERR